MKIAKRTSTGWTSYQLNHAKYTCDDCGQRLYVAPDGKTKYCDNSSNKHKDNDEVTA